MIPAAPALVPQPDAAALGAQEHDFRAWQG